MHPKWNSGRFNILCEDVICDVITADVSVVIIRAPVW